MLLHEVKTSSYETSYRVYNTFGFYVLLDAFYFQWTEL